MAALGCGGLLSRAAVAEPSELPPEIGWNYGELETPRVAAMGGALRAFGNPMDGLFFNPANMAATRVYHLGVTAQIWPEAQRQTYGGGAVDSIVSSSRLAGGFGGAWTLQDPEGIDRRATDLRFALAYPFDKVFFLGLGGRYLWLSQDGIGPLGTSVTSGGLAEENIVRTITLDAGVTLRPVPEFALAFAGQNLTNPGSGFLPTTLGGGAAVGTTEFSLEGDVVVDFTTWDTTRLRVMGGGELLAGDHFPLRLGWRWDEGAGSHALSGGLGYLDRAFSAELAVRRTVMGEPATAIVFGFKAHLEATGMTPDPSEGF